jgi:hypothetical protein
MCSASGKSPALSWEMKHAYRDLGCLLSQALFERALSAKETQQCALLWRAYIGYELSRGRPEAARRVYLRAIHACPWSKVHTHAPYCPATVQAAAGVARAREMGKPDVNRAAPNKALMGVRGAFAVSADGGRCCVPHRRCGWMAWWTLARL